MLLNSTKIDAKIYMFGQFPPPGARSVDLRLFPFWKSCSFAAFTASPFNFYYFFYNFELSFTAASPRGLCFRFFVPSRDLKRPLW